MSRNKLVITLLIFVVAFGCVVALIRKQAGQTWRLPDGSKLSLAKVSYGTTHEMAYGNGWRDYLYPILPTEFRAKLGCKVGKLIAAEPDTIVVWFWLRNIPQTISSPPSIVRLSPYQLAVVDENDLESELQSSPAGRYILPSGDELQLWRLKERPRQNKNVGIRVYSYHLDKGLQSRLLGS